jgi:hypothetical protein
VSEPLIVNKVLVARKKRLPSGSISKPKISKAFLPF